MFDDLLGANQTYASHFALAGVPAQAAKGFALVTCMDSRIEPLAMLGLVPGDAKILRNAGGRATVDVVRSLVLATTFLGVRRVAVMHHTGCALAGQSDEGVREGVSAAGRGSADRWEFLARSRRRVAPRRRADPQLPAAPGRHAGRRVALRRRDRPRPNGRGPSGLTVEGRGTGSVDRGPLNWEGRTMTGSLG
jgi:carbonic anhydrase